MTMTQFDSVHQLLAEIRAEIATSLPSGRARVLLALLHAGETEALTDDTARTRLARLLTERERILPLLHQEALLSSESARYVAVNPIVEHYYREIGEAFVARFACQHSYPASTSIGGATIGQYTDILALLIGWL